MPNIIIDNRDKAPPEKMFRNPKSWLEEKNSRSFWLSMPGIGTAAINLKITNKAAITKIFRRKSLILKIWIIFFIVFNLNRYYNKETIFSSI